jgi:hypothetical protein
VKRADVTVVVTAYNDSKHIGTCLESLLAQRGADWACIVLDDASTDATLETVSATIGSDHRFVVITGDRNEGVSRQRNAGIQAAQTEYVAFLDADDFLLPGSLESRMAVMQRRRHPALAGSVCTWAMVPEGATPDHPYEPLSPPPVSINWFNTLLGIPLLASACLIRKDALLAVGGFRRVAEIEDIDLWQRMMRAGFWFTGVPNVGLGYRQRASSLVRVRPRVSARLIAELVGAQIRPHTGPPLQGPYELSGGLDHHLAPMIHLKHLIRALAMGVAAGRDITPDLAEIRDLFAPYMEWCLDIPSLVLAGANAASLTDGGTLSPQDLAAQVMDALGQFIEGARGAAAAWMTNPSSWPQLDIGETSRRPVAPNRR